MDYSGYDYFIEGGAFNVQRISKEVRTYRFTMLAAIVTLAIRNAQMGFFSIEPHFSTIVKMDSSRRYFLLDDPAFCRWLDLTLIAVNKLPASLDSVNVLLQSFPGLLERVAQREVGPDFFRISGTAVLVQRNDIDPLIKDAAPPSYSFEKEENSGKKTNSFEILPKIGHFIEYLEEAFKNIEECDPWAYNMVLQQVRVIGYTPDSVSRSCSAVRYRGVILLSGREHSIIDLEESIIHEAAHQLLYKISELYPITEIGTRSEATFELPWSGSHRDVFGYFHAYFIYLQLVKYFDYRAPTSGYLRQTVLLKRDLFHKGLQIAGKDLVQAKGITEYGRGLLDLLIHEVERLKTDSRKIASLETEQAHLD